MFYFTFNYFVPWQLSISKIYVPQVPTAVQLEADLCVFMKRRAQSAEECDSHFSSHVM